MKLRMRLALTYARASRRQLTLGRRADALRFGLRALALAERAVGPEDPQLVPLLNNLGVACKESALFDEGRRALERGLALAGDDLRERLRENLADLESAAIAARSDVNPDGPPGVEGDER